MRRIKITSAITTLAAASLLASAPASAAGAIGTRPVASAPASAAPAAPILPPVQPKTPPPKDTSALTVQTAPPLTLVKAKLTSLTLAQTVMTLANPASVVFTLQGDRPIANCQLEYELRTNMPGSDTINLSIINPLDYGSPTGAWSLPIQGQKITFGSLFENGKDRLGKLRFFLRAKNTPNNMCTGEAYADFEIKAAAPSPLSPVAVKLGTEVVAVTAITGVSVEPNWYDYLRKKYTIAIQGKGAPECAYQVVFKNDSLGTTIPDVNMEGHIPQVLDTFSAVLPAGNYTITVKPGTVSNTNNPNIRPCTGQASVTTKISVPADAMAISSTAMHVIKNNATAFTQKDATLGLDEFKAIALDVKFAHDMNLLHNTPNSCYYKIVTKWPQGGSSEAYFAGQGVADNGIAVTLDKGAGQYLIRVEGTTAVPGGNSETIACVGGPFEHKVTLLAPASNLKIESGAVIKK